MTKFSDILASIEAVLIIMMPTSVESALFAFLALALQPIYEK